MLFFFVYENILFSKFAHLLIILLNRNIKFSPISIIYMSKFETRPFILYLHMYRAPKFFDTSNP